jgi:hypothetical protein
MVLFVTEHLLASVVCLYGSVIFSSVLHSIMAGKGFDSFDMQGYSSYHSGGPPSAGGTLELFLVSIV